MKFWTLPVLALVFLWSCSGERSETLPPASGLSGDMYLIMDSLQHQGPLGVAIDSVFNVEMEVINRTEPIFKLRWIDPRKLNFVLKQRRNLIFVFTLDHNSAGASRIKGMFTRESLDKIKNDTSFYLTSSKNRFAKNQEVMFLVGRSEDELLRKFKREAAKIVEHFNRTERERLTKSLYKAGQLKGVNELIKKNFGVEFNIPFGYQLVQDDSTFLWARQINPRDDKDIFIARKKYTSQAQLQLDSLIAFRNAICKKYLFGNPDKPQSYLVTELGIPYKLVQARQVNFNGNWAVEMRGLWRTNNITMGGPFLSYSLVDEKQGILYYIEGFVYSPDREQRELLRELETILHTFRTQPK